MANELVLSTGDFKAAEKKEEKAVSNLKAHTGWTIDILPKMINLCKELTVEKNAFRYCLL